MKTNPTSECPRGLRFCRESLGYLFLRKPRNKIVTYLRQHLPETADAFALFLVVFPGPVHSSHDLSFVSWRRHHLQFMSVFPVNVLVFSMTCIYVVKTQVSY
jgi:hypothetical protein